MSKLLLEVDSTTDQAPIEQVLYCEIDEEQFAIYRARFGDSRIYNLVANDLRQLTKRNKNHNRTFMDFDRYKVIQTSKVWHNDFRAAVKDLVSRNFQVPQKLFILPRFRQGLLDGIEFRAEGIVDSWTRALSEGN